MNFFLSAVSFSCKIAHLPFVSVSLPNFILILVLILFINITQTRIKITLNIFIQPLNLQLRFLFLVAHNCIHKLGMAPGQRGHRD